MNGTDTITRTEFEIRAGGFVTKDYLRHALDGLRAESAANARMAAIESRAETVNMVDSKVHGVRLEVFANSAKERAALKSEILDSVRQSVNEALAPFDVKMERGFATLANEISGVRAELKTEIGAVRAELKGEIGAVKTELKGDFNRLRAEVNTLKGAVVRLDSRVEDMRTDIRRIDTKMDQVIDIVSKGYGVHEKRLNACEAKLMHVNGSKAPANGQTSS